MEPALNVIQGLLEQETSLCYRTVLSAKNIIQLLGFSLHNTYFSFQGQFYEQVEGAAMVSSVSPIVANVFLEHCERKALSMASTPRGYGWDVDDKFVIQQEEHKEIFLEHINKVDPAMKFTVESNQQDGAIPYHS